MHKRRTLFISNIQQFMVHLILKAPENTEGVAMDYVAQTNKVNIFEYTQKLN